MWPTFAHVFPLVAWAVGVEGQMLPVLTLANSNFIGYYVKSGTNAEVMTATNWVTSDSYAIDCFRSASCAMATKCEDGTVYYNDDVYMTCLKSFSCVTMTIFATSLDILPSAVNYACRGTWSANTVYRQIAATTTVSSSLASSSLALNTITLGPSRPTFTLTSTSVLSTPTSALLPAPTPQNMAWIAGAVIGPVVGIALVVAAIIWWRRRARVKSGSNQAVVQSYGNPSKYVPVKQYHNREHSFQLAELESSQQPLELSTYRSS